MDQYGRYVFRTGITGFIAFLLFICAAFYPLYAQEREETQLWQKANAFIIQAKWKQAISSYQELLIKFPKTRYVEARFWIGYSNLELKKFDQGIKDLQEFAEKNPGNEYAPQAIFKVGETWENHYKQYEKAIVAYGRIARQYPGSPASVPAYQNQAMIYQEKKKDYKKAEEALEESRNSAMSQGMDPGNAYVSRANERIRFIKDNSDYDYKPLSLFTDAINLEQDKRWNEAAGIYQALLDKYPKANITDDAMYRRIICLMNLRLYDKARAEASKFMKDFPRSPFAQKVRDLIDEAKKRSYDMRFMPAAYV
ncbi:MAG: tetratricopeptide repeat protein [Firmicutes bacterium]|nr:tetratricopeptide repeat protein [Bacillota bacterium]